MRFSIFFSVVLLCILAGCDSEGTEENHSSQLDVAIMGNSYLLVPVENDKTNHKATIVILYDDLEKLLCNDGYSSGQLSKDLDVAFQNGTSINVDPKVFSRLERDIINEDSLDSLSTPLDKDEYINSIFNKNENGVYYKCFEDWEYEKIIIYILIDKFKIFPSMDDESGCIVLPH